MSFNGRKCNSNQKWNNDKCRFQCKNPRGYHECKIDYIQYPATCSCGNGKYLASIISDSVIMCHEIINTTKKVPINFNERKVTCKTKKYIYFTCFFINYYSIIDS